MKLSQAIQQTFLSAINKQIKDKHGSTPIVGMFIKGNRMTFIINEYNCHHATKILFSAKFKNFANKNGNYKYKGHHGPISMRPIINFETMGTSLRKCEIDMPTEVALGTLILNFINAKQV